MSTKNFILDVAKNKRLKFTTNVRGISPDDTNTLTLKIPSVFDANWQFYILFRTRDIMPSVNDRFISIAYSTPMTLTAEIVTAGIKFVQVKATHSAFDTIWMTELVVFPYKVLGLGLPPDYWD